MVDAKVYCGIGSFLRDDTNASTNANATGGRFGRTDVNCWGGYTEAHELMHNLGGVQYSAPHSSGGAHCYDDYDRMCYSDGGTYYTNGGTLQQICAASHEYLFDCNHDDYYSTSPPAGSYLATHWNVASSPFLETVAGSTTGTTPTTQPPATTTTQPPATTTTKPATTSVSYSGSTASGSVTYAFSTGTGTMASTTSWSGGFLIFAAPSLTVTITDATGRVLASRTGSSPLAVSAPVVRGTNRISVSGSSTSFTMRATYPTP